MAVDAHGRVHAETAGSRQESMSAVELPIEGRPRRIGSPLRRDRIRGPSLEPVQMHVLHVQLVPTGPQKIVGPYFPDLEAGGKLHLPQERSVRREDQG